MFKERTVTVFKADLKSKTEKVQKKKKRKRLVQMFKSVLITFSNKSIQACRSIPPLREGNGKVKVKKGVIGVCQRSEAGKAERFAQLWTDREKERVYANELPKSIKAHSMPSRVYSSCSRTNMWWLKNCCNFSFVKLMHSCSKLLNCGG